MSLRCLRSLPCASILAFLIAVVGCITFTVLFDRALKGFAFQLNTLVPFGSLIGIRWSLLAVAVIFVLFAFGFFLIGVVSTSESARCMKADLLDVQPLLSQLITSPFVIGIFSFGLIIYVMLWTLVVCMSAVFASFYVIFIGSINSFCHLIDNQCFDFTVLLPAIINRISSKNVDLKFCADKKEILCAVENNQISTFIIAHLFAMISLLGLIYFLMCTTANYTKIRSNRRARKSEAVLNQGTVDSNSFILTNMRK